MNDDKFAVSSKEELEMQVDVMFGKIVRDLTTFLQSERDRLVETGSCSMDRGDSRIIFKGDSEFSKHLHTLFALSVGNFEGGTAKRATRKHALPSQKDEEAGVAKKQYSPNAEKMGKPPPGIGTTWKKEVEKAIDADFAQIVQGLTAFLQSERDRLVEVGAKLAENGKLGGANYKRTLKFSKHLKKLIESSVAEFKLTHHHSKKAKKRAISLANLAPEIPPQILQANYKSAKFVGATKFSRPTAIVAMPERNCFAVKHHGFISLVSGTGNILHPKPSVLTPISVLTRNPANNQLIGVRFGDIFSIEPPHFTAECGNLEPHARIKEESGVPFGLAICGKTERLFTAFGKSIVSYSLTDWSMKGKWVVPGRVRGPFVLGVNNGLLFFKDEVGNSRLYTVPLDKNGDLKMGEKRRCGTELGIITALAFDEESNNVLAILPGYIKVLSPSGDQVLATIRPPIAYSNNFYPTAIATLQNYENRRYSRTIAVVDYLGNEVLFFGLPISK